MNKILTIVVVTVINLTVSTANASYLQKGAVVCDQSTVSTEFINGYYYGNMDRGWGVSAVINLFEHNWPYRRPGCLQMAQPIPIVVENQPILPSKLVRFHAPNFGPIPMLVLPGWVR